MSMTREEAMMASSSPKKEKFKTPFAQLIVGGEREKPCFSILFFDPNSKEFHIGFSSFSLEYVFNWLDEEFEVVEDENFVLSALRPVSREQITKMWPGCDSCEIPCSNCESVYKWDRYGKPQECTGCQEGGYKNYTPESQFCEFCGRPLTDEAVEMVMERLEALR